MKGIAWAAVSLVFLVSIFAGWGSLEQPDAYVVGGTYVIRSGDVVAGNVRALFAQVQVEEGARVAGRILAMSSTLDLAGAVSGDIMAVGSDVMVRQTAKLVSAPRRLAVTPYVFLLPQMLRAGNAARGSR